ncbi:MAG: hypothetical protein ABSF25_08990 [Bryobacteraceae bacterium]|jgi:hypothetical protein
MKAILLVAVVWSLFIGAGPLLSAEDPLACVEELTMPHYNFAMTGEIPATVGVSVAIGPGGRAESIKLSPADTPLRFELLDDFGPRTRYSGSCQGKTIVFVVRYLVEGERTDFPIAEVRYRPPNEIVVVCRPMKPGLN